MNILVTGGAGFVGAHFVRAAIDAGHRVVVVDDFSGGATEPPPRETECLRGDVGDRALVRDAIRRRAIDAAAHFAGKIQVGESIRAPGLYYDVNVVRSLAFLDQADDPK